MAVHFTVIGSSPAWPNPGSAQSGYLVEGPGRLLLDCGPGVLARLRERWSWPEIDAIVITHWHLDHWGDLVPWVWGQTLGPGIGTPRAELWVPPGGRSKLETFGELLGTREMFDDAFDVREYADASEFETGGFTVLARRVVHYRLEAFGLRVSADGTTIAYSGDSGPTTALGELARDADLLVCEATLDRLTLEGDTRGHLSVDEALAVVRDTGVRRLLLTHRPEERPLDSDVELARDGLVIEL